MAQNPSHLHYAVDASNFFLDEEARGDYRCAVLFPPIDEVVTKEMHA